MTLDYLFYAIIPDGQLCQTPESWGLVTQWQWQSISSSSVQFRTLAPNGDRNQFLGVSDVTVKMESTVFLLNSLCSLLVKHCEMAGRRQLLSFISTPSMSSAPCKLIWPERMSRETPFPESTHYLIRSGLPHGNIILRTGAADMDWS